MADIDYNQLAESIANAMGRATDARQAAADTAKLEKENQARTESIKNLLELTSTVKKANKEHSGLNKLLSGQQSTWRDLTKELEALDKAIKEATETNQQETKAKLQRTREEIISSARLSNFKATLNDAALGLVKFAGQLTSIGVSAGVQYAKSLQRGGSSIEAASGVLAAGVDMASAGVRTVTSGMETIGSSLMTAGGWKTKATGAALVGLSKAVGFSTEKMSELAKGGIEILATEIQKSIDTYNAAASAGAIFATGVKELRDASYDAGISVVSMSNIIKNNADSMYYSGMNIGKATKKVSSAFAEGGDSFKNSLFNLGYSIEEQGALISDTMKYLSIAGRNVQAMTGGEVAAATKDYAVNLKAIAAITGDDAKKRMEQAREAAANAAVQAKLAQMDPETRKRFQADLAMVPPALKNAVLQQRVLGTVTDRNANILMAMVPGFDRSVRGMSAGLGQGAEVMGQWREEMAQNIKTANERGDTEALGIVGLVGLSGAAADANTALIGLTTEFQKGATSIGASAEALTDIQAMMDTKQAMQEQMSALQTQTGHLIAEIEKVTGEQGLPKFGRVLEQVNEHMIKMVTEGIKTAGDIGLGQDNEPGFFEKYGAKIAAALSGAVTGAGAGAQVGGAAGSFVIPGIGTVGGGAVGAVVGGVLGGLTGWFSSNTAKNARGGITQAGKLNIAGEEGPEAIVPLDSGKNIPVVIKGLASDERTEIPESFLSLYKDWSRNSETLTGETIKMVKLGRESSSEISDSILEGIRGIQEFSQDLTRIQDFFASLSQPLVNFDKNQDNTIELSAKSIAQQMATMWGKDQKAGDDRPKVLMAHEITQLREVDVSTKNIAEDYLEPQLNSLASSQSLLTDITQNLSSVLSEFMTEIKNKVNEIKTPTSTTIQTVEQPTTKIEMTTLVDVLTNSNQELKETLIAQNRLLEQSVRSAEELVSVATDTRTYSQTIAQNSY